MKPEIGKTITDEHSVYLVVGYADKGRLRVRYLCPLWFAKVMAQVPRLQEDKK